jgi:hypothetical protein
MSSPTNMILKIIEKKISEISPEQLGDIGLAIHRELGGRRFYFGKAPTAVNAARLADEVAQGIPMHQAAKNIGCTVRHARRLLKTG